MPNLILCAVFSITAYAPATQSRANTDFWRSKYREIERAFNHKDAKQLKARLASDYKIRDPAPEHSRRLWPSPEPPANAKIFWNALKVKAIDVEGDTAKVAFVWGYRYDYTPERTPEQRMWDPYDTYRIRVHLTGTDTWKRTRGKWLLTNTDYSERKREVNWYEKNALAEGTDYLASPSTDKKELPEPP